MSERSERIPTARAPASPAASERTPSWVTPPSAGPTRSARPERPAPPAPPVTLVLALVATTVLAAGQAVHVAGRDELVVGLRVFLVAVVAFQVVLAVGVTRRSPGAALGLLLCQLTTALASLGGGFGDQRVLFVAGSVLVVVLVAVSLGAFPPVPLPPIDPGSR